MMLYNLPTLAWYRFSSETQSCWTYKNVSSACVAEVNSPVIFALQMINSKSLLSTNILSQSEPISLPRNTTNVVIFFAKIAVYIERDSCNGVFETGSHGCQSRLIHNRVRYRVMKEM